MTQTPCEKALDAAGATYAIWITAIRNGHVGTPQANEYFAAKEIVIAEMCQVHNEALAAHSDEELAELEMPRENWDPKCLNDFARAWIDQTVYHRAVEFLVKVLLDVSPAALESAAARRS